MQAIKDACGNKFNYEIEQDNEKASIKFFVASKQDPNIPKVTSQWGGHTDHGPQHGKTELSVILTARPDATFSCTRHDKHTPDKAGWASPVSMELRCVEDV